MSSSFSQCKTGYSCQSTVVGAVFGGMQDGYCCQGTGGGGQGNVNGGCPPGQVTQMDASGNYLQCNPFVASTNSGCQSAFSCQYVQANNRYQCCGQATTTALVCSNGGQLQQSNGVSVQCQLGGGNVCQSPTFMCIATTTPNVFACCTTTGGGNPTACQSNQVFAQGQCLNRATPGQSCIVQDQCMGNSLCVGGQCICPPGTVNQNGACQSGGGGTTTGW